MIEPAGVFLALADESFVISTHDDIAGSFHQMSVGPWLLTVYSLGYTISLPTVGASSGLPQGHV